MTPLGSRALRMPLLLTNPGDTPAEILGDLFRKGRNTDPGIDEEGTLITDWVLLAHPGTVILPLAEVQDPETGLLYWVHGYPEHVRSLLRGVVDHVEARLKTVYRVWTVADIIRDSDSTDRNDLGDPIDTPDGPPPGRAGVPISIVEVVQIVPTDTDLRTHGTWVGWVDESIDARIGDRVRVVGPSDGDEPPIGAAFRVEGVTQPVHIGLREKRLELTRTDSA